MQLPEVLMVQNGRLTIALHNSDLHLSLGTDKPMDIFPGWGNHVEKIEANWNSKITDEDTVVLLATTPGR